MLSAPNYTDTRILLEGTPDFLGTVIKTFFVFYHFPTFSK